MKFNIIPIGKKKIHACYIKLDSIDKSRPTKNHIVQHGFFADVDMRCGHYGLNLIAKKRRINLDKLKPGEMVVFINRYQDKAKVYTTGYSYVYMKLPNRQRINPGVIGLIPKFFNGNSIDYDSALRKVIERELG